MSVESLLGSFCTSFEDEEPSHSPIMGSDRIQTETTATIRAMDNNVNDGSVEYSNLEDKRNDDVSYDMNSFLTMMRMLRSFILSDIDKTYHICGPISGEEREKLLAYTRKIKDFTFTGLSALNEHPIAPAAFLRLFQLLYNQATPFFPCLTRLLIVDADSSFAQFWPFFLAPTLESLEIGRITLAQQDMVASFLITLLHETPKISSIKLGPGVIPLYIIDVCLRFIHLRDLNLMEAAGNIVDYSLLKEIGKVPNLENLVLNIPEEINLDTVKFEDDGFPKLKILHVAGVLEILKHIIGKIRSTELKSIDIALIKSPNGEIWLEDSGSRRMKNKKKPIKKSTRICEFDEFASLVGDISSKWSTTLTSICIRQQGSHPSTNLFTYYLPAETLRRLLLLENLECLKIYDWNLNYDVEEKLRLFTETADAAVSKLRILHFPADAMQTVSLGILHLVAKAYPDLVSFQCNILDLSDVPDCLSPEASKDLPYHKLEELSVGSGALTHPDQLEDPYHLLRIAQYLDILFPNLKVIKTSDGGGFSSWMYLDKLVKMCQTSRSYHRVHLP